MSENTTIEWCDHTINFWHGCTKVSPGCANCYAEGISRRWGKDIWGQVAPREDHRASATKLALKLDRAAAKAGTRPRVFCASMGDWLDEEVPIDWLADMLDVIRTTPHLDWLLLTKRPGLWYSRIKEVVDFYSNRGAHDACNWICTWLYIRSSPENVWIGTTVEDWPRAYDRVPELLRIPAKVRFLSCEPMLGPLNLLNISAKCSILGKINWVICGGESGTKARPMHPDWARSLRDQCAAAGVPFFFKQWGGKKSAGRLLDGREHNEFPKTGG